MNLNWSREALANVGLEHTLDMLPAELSGGIETHAPLHGRLFSSQVL